MSDPQYETILTKGVESNLPVTYTDGKIRVTTDEQNLYLDLPTSRIKITDVIATYTETEIKSLASPIASKLYVASNTGKAFVYRSCSWINVGECSLSADTSTNSDLVIWFSGTNGTQPNYNSAVTFNPYTGTFKSTHAEFTTVTIDGLSITVTENPDHSHKTLFSF